jgi:hypothetical protein
MRITTRLDYHAKHDAFAVLWLDTDSCLWSREMHDGVDIPSWGLLRFEPGATLIFDQHGPIPLCALIGLDGNDATRVAEDQVGHAVWYGDPAPGLQPDRWQVRCVDVTQTKAENGVFAE